MQDKALYTTLAFAGALPFLACAILPLFGVISLKPFGPLDQLASSYGLAIICFLTGIHWATYLYRQEELPLNLIVGSNVLFLITWFLFVLGGLFWSLVTQIIILLVLLLIDWKLRVAAVISADYFQARLVATVIAVTSLILIVLR